VTYEGRFDRVTGAGLAPLPVQRPIPIWLGAQSPAAYRRIGRLADGWFPQVAPGPELDNARAVIIEAATEAGRDPSALGMEGRISLGTGGADDLVEHAQRWRDARATHVAVNTMGSGLSGVDAHLEALTLAAEALQLLR
jgi:alkanesulfonate monooxygenase SsuD/methylene tetrahydromethanopterin reductase-like flavin-dependent oxidoreductase (luciferase family)